MSPEDPLIPVPTRNLLSHLLFLFHFIYPMSELLCRRVRAGVNCGRTFGNWITGQTRESNVWKMLRLGRGMGFRSQSCNGLNSASMQSLHSVKGGLYDWALGPVRKHGIPAAGWMCAQGSVYVDAIAGAILVLQGKVTVLYYICFWEHWHVQVTLAPIGVWKVPWMLTGNKQISRFLN